MTFGEHILTHPGDIVINGVPYKLDINPRSNPPNQLAWEEEPILRGSEPKSERGLSHVRIAPNAWLSEQIIDTYHMGVHNPLWYEYGTYHYSEGIDASKEGYAVLAPLQTTVAIAVSPGTEPNGFFLQDGRFYVEWGRYIRQIDTPSGTPTEAADKDFGAGVEVRDVKLFNSVAVVALGSGQVFETRAAGAAPGTYAAAAAGLTADFFETNESFLYRADSDGSNSLVYACAQGDDPTLAASWGAPIEVGGDATASFTDLKSYGFQILIARSDGLYRTNRQGFTPNLIEAWRNLRSSVNGKQMVVAGNDLYVPYVRGMQLFDGRVMHPIGLPKIDVLGGVYHAGTSDEDKAYFALDDGDETWIVTANRKGDEVIWHTFVKWNSNQVRGLFLWEDGPGLPGFPQLWATSTTNDLVSRWILNPNLNNQIMSAIDVAASGLMYIPRLYMGSEENTKRFLDVVVEGDNMSSTETIAFAYRTTSNIPWSTSSPAFTTLVTATTSPTTTALNVAGLFIEPRITMARGSTVTETPLLRRIKIRALQFPTFYRSVKCSIVLPPDAQAYEGGETIGSIDDNTTETSYGVLRTLRANSSSFTVIDPWGVSRTMYIASAERAQPILPGDPHEEPNVVIELVLVEAPS